VLTPHPGQGPEEEVWRAPRKWRRFATPSRVSSLNSKTYNPQDSILTLHFSLENPKLTNVQTMNFHGLTEVTFLVMPQ
jgi:hypothetical protein